MNVCLKVLEVCVKAGVIFFLAVLLGAAGEAAAQSDRASITGTIRDSSGALIPETQVTLDNSASTFRLTSKTNELGVYRLVNVPIGQYSLSCVKAGFSSYTRSGINLAIGQSAEIDIVLPVAAKQETVVVTGDAALLESQTSSISTNLNNAAVTELPLNVQGGRNLSSFMFAFVPGVEGSDFTSHINGSLSQTKEVMVDGTSAVSQIGGYLSESAPPMEGVEEFQVTSAGLRADEGRSGGGG